MNSATLQNALATSDLVKRFYFYPEIDSTMSQARRLIGTDDAAHHHGTLLIADHQQAGRGRHGRNWSAPPATSLLVTLVIARDHLPAATGSTQLSLLAAAIPVALCRAIARFLPAVRIKYPNDIVVDGRKLGGILLENCGGVILAGFGINCHQELGDLPPDSRMPASSLFLETGRRLHREDILVAILDEIQTALSPDAFYHAGDDMRALCETLGRTICIDRGVDVITGRARTIAADGTLILETPEGLQTVYTTEVVRTWSPEVGQ